MDSAPVVVRLMGGLGNQIFQYAFGKKLAREGDSHLLLDSRFLGVARTKRSLGLNAFKLNYKEADSSDLERFNLEKVDTAHRKFPKKFRRRSNLGIVVHEPGMGHYPGLQTANVAGTYFVGFWQSYKYFDGLRSSLLQDLEIREPLTNDSKRLSRAIESERSICLNVRRGDYANDPKTRAYHGLMGSEYYLTALAELRKRGDYERVFIFSDEPEWCRENLGVIPGATVVGHEHAGPSFSHYLHLMTMCSGFVIPNSTFGWWGAWLSAAPPSAVVAPKAWFAAKDIDNSDLIPPGWSLS